MSEQPKWICHNCAIQYAHSPNRQTSWLVGHCDICGEVHEVTDPRNLDWVRPEWLDAR